MDEKMTRLTQRVLQNASMFTSTMVKENRGEWQREKTPLAELINYIINQAVDMSASDIHLEPAGESAKIRFRIDGILRSLYEDLPIDLYGNLISRIKILCQLNIAETRMPQDGRFAFMYANKELDIRTSVVPVIYGEKIVMRLLNNDNNLKDLNNLDLSQHNKKVLMEYCNSNNGAMLITGPVNSGKTTVMYAMMQQLNIPSRNLVSIEDPVEYHMEGINQIQVNEKINMTFELALKSILRQDFDCLAVGEIRSSDTAELFITAALTGKKVFSTMHTAGAIKSIVRLLDMGIKSYLVATAISCVLNQRLLGRLCTHCKEVYTVAEGGSEAEFLGDEYVPQMKLYRRKGCPECDYSGYQGRIAIQELLTMSNELSEAVIRGDSTEKLQQLALQQGMISLKEDGIAKAKAGVLDLGELMSICTML